MNKISVSVIIVVILGLIIVRRLSYKNNNGPNGYGLTSELAYGLLSGENGQQAIPQRITQFQYGGAVTRDCEIFCTFVAHDENIARILERGYQHVAYATIEHKFIAPSQYTKHFEKEWRLFVKASDYYQYTVSQGPPVVYSWLAVNSANGRVHAVIGSW